MIHKLADVQSQMIGEHTRIWQFVVVLPRANIGVDCNICSHCLIENQVTIGDRVTIKSGVQIWDGITLEDDVFIGPNVTFANDKMPRSKKIIEDYPQTVDENIFYPYSVQKRVLLRKAYGISEKDFVLLSLSRLNPVKNIESVIMSVPYLQKKTGFNVKLFIVGDGKPSYIEELERLTREAGLEKKVFWFGNQLETTKFYNLCDTYILASYSEGMSNSLLEALACGCVCYATDVGEARMVLPGELIIPGFSSTDIADAIARKYANVQSYNLQKPCIEALREFLSGS